MQIVIMGTGPFAVPAAKSLAAAGHEIPLVVTRPLVDPRAKKQPPRPVFEWASQAGYEIFEPPSINDAAAIAKLQQVSAELFFVCDYGQILSKECLSAAPLGGINLHGSLLPRHRGAAPVQWALLRGDARAGVTVIHMTPRLDAGPALAVASTTILPDETAEELEPRLAEIGVTATLQAVEQLAGWDRSTTLGELQDKSLVTKAPRFSKADGQLDFRLPAEYLVRLVRACQPWPGTYGVLRWPEGKEMRLMIRRARAATRLPAELQQAQPGTAVPVDGAEFDFEQVAPWKRLLAIRCAEGVLLVSRLQPAGKREMDAADFLRGHPIGPPPAFQLPPEPLQRLDA